MYMITHYVLVLQYKVPVVSIMENNVILGTVLYRSLPRKYSCGFNSGQET